MENTDGSRRKLSFLGFGKRMSVDGHGAEMGPELDEEMEKVFAMDTGEKFDVARLGSPSESVGSDRDRDRGPSSRYGDRDFNQHRKRSYPHPHMPLKSLHSRSMRRHLSPEGSAVEVSTEEEHSNVQPRSNEFHEADGINNILQPASTAETNAEVDEETAEETENVISSESEAPISERAASGFSDSPSVGSPRVQFEKIKEEETSCAQIPEAPADVASNGHEEDRKCRRHQKHEHKYYWHENWIIDT